MKTQRGGFVAGLLVGLLIGLALALGVALYITKVPVPFMNKVPMRTPEQDSAEAERNKNWDPNAPLAGKAASRPANTVSGVVQPDSAPAPAPTPAAVPARPAASAARPAKDPAAILAGGAPADAASAAGKPAKPGADPFIYFVQAGAYTRAEDAEQQRASLGLLGLTAKVTEREQSGRTVYRVRLGPFDKKEDADAAQDKLKQASIEAALVRVERQ